LDSFPQRINPVVDPRITWFRGKLRPGPRQTIGVLEVRGNGACRAVFAERAEIDGRAHIQLARRAWGPKDSLDTRWWSLVPGLDNEVCTVRNGSCGDPLNMQDIPVVVRALRDLSLLSENTMIAVDDGPAVFPGWSKERRERVNHATRPGQR
jgi:hypothetical protein